MFNYYLHSSVCYAYLVDVNASPPAEGKRDVKEQFASSSWFTRGWTLQELLGQEQSIGMRYAD